MRNYGNLGGMPSPTKKTVRRESMSSSLKCFHALELLAQEPYELPLSELAARMEQPLASVHRLVATLVEAGFVEQDSASRRYRLAGKALWTGAGYLRNSPVYRASFLVMQEAARKSAGLIHLGALHGEWVLYLHTVGSPSSLYLYADTGERRPLHATGLGKAILAWQPNELVNRITAHKLQRFTKYTICSASDLREEMKAIRQRGYAIDNEEGVVGLRCVAAPIFNASGLSVAALSMSAPVQVLSNQAIETAAAQIREAAMKISVQVGFRPASSNMLSLISG
jgi:IclR family KDG regulon transcriptional repressor